MTNPGDLLGQVFGALADANRRQVIGYLSEYGTATATELTGELPMTRQAVAKHLATLADAGLVESERQGRETRYRLTEAGAEWDDRLDALARHLQRRRPLKLAAMATYDAVRELPLTIEGYELEPLEQEVAREFTLRRTVVVLRGNGEEGRGEEVDYDPQAQQQFQARRNELPFAGEHTLDSFSLLQAGQTEYRRWAFESAALDLALRQAGKSLGEAIGREQRPVRFVVSTRIANVPGWLDLYPEHPLQARPRPQLDGRDRRPSVWRGRRRHRRLQRDLPRRLRLAAGPRAVRADRRGVPGVVDRGPRAHARDVTRARAAPGPHHVGRARSTSGATSRRFPFRPRCLNCKPSRFGSVRRLFEFYDACEREGITLYGGGQYELGPGRAQIQLLASLFHADAPNDVAPGGYNATEPVAGLPASPLELSSAGRLPKLSAFAESRRTEPSPASPIAYQAAPSHGSPLPTTR